MGKKILSIAALIGFVYCTSFGQSDFDRKLQSLYKNTVPLVRSESLVTEISKQNVVILDTRSAKNFRSAIYPARFFWITILSSQRTSKTSIRTQRSSCIVVWAIEASA